MASISDAIKQDLSAALRNGEVEEAEAVTRRALDEGAKPLDLIQNVIVPELTRVGQDFQDFVIFLPELMSAGDAAAAATAILEEAMVASGTQVASPGTVVIGTVENDVHDIGKNIVSTLLRSHGFKVFDLGRNVAPSAFLDAAEREKADVVAMSSLMTTTRPSARSTIALFGEVGVRDRFKMIVGGGSITPEWADEIGADGYSADAAGAVELCKELLGI
jgi:5-methyltetrahydrofolate--homocysteine methyltransferase